MNKKCDKCLKTVYPTEELKCLDKTWHKACFKCTVCNMTLNMKNYKGYDKHPYCNAHYPSTKFTPIADTPENRRLAENTKIQSNIKYHADHERDKGKFTAIADDPETLRIRENMKTISQAEYQNIKDKKDQMEQLRPTQEEKQRVRHQMQVLSHGAAQHVYQYHPGQEHHAKKAYASGHGGQQMVQQQQPHQQHHQQQQQQHHPQQQQHHQQQQHQAPHAQAPMRHHPQQSRVGAIVDYDPVNEHHSSQAAGYSPASQGAPGARQSAHAQPVPHSPRPSVFRAMYDYEAADTDEVSFIEGDRIVNVKRIDAGWVIGTVERSGHHGMLPANYVEEVKY